MSKPRRTPTRRRLHRLVVVGGLISVISALRTLALARNEKRFPELVAPPHD